MLCLRVFRPCVHQITGILDAREFVYILARLCQWSDVQDVSLHEETVTAIFSFISHNTIWFQYAHQHKNRLYILFTQEIVKKIRECALFKATYYQKLLHIVPIRLCKHCLCFTDVDQHLCSKHIKMYMILRRLLCDDLVYHVMTCYGICIYKRDHALFRF